MDQELMHKTIFNYMGGDALRVMTGAKSFTCDMKKNNMLGFRLPSNTANKNINAVLITYVEGKDLFTMTFKRIRGMDVKTISEHEDCYAEDLLPIFEGVTGLITSIPKFA